MAMLIFKKADMDFCILETGLGGRLDATNAVSVKAVSVITRISLDHVQYLGDTVEKIAGEKAGIIMAGVPCVYTDSSDEASAVFENKCAKLGVKATAVSENDYALVNFRNKSIDFSLHTRYYGYVGLKIATIARYQMENAALAVRAVEILDKGLTVSEKAVKDGIAKAFWSGRMEEVLPDVYVDGAHNEDGVRAFLDTVKEDGLDEGRLLLFGAVADKDIRHMISQITASKLFEHVAVTRLKTGRGADADILKSYFIQDSELKCSVYDGVKEALTALLKEKKDGQRIYIAGSLYLAGEIKELLIND
jgi:dihydrofolate synthase/folylpolyglutamate synthase